MQAAEKKCVIWRVTDGKRGHDNQAEGLVQALAELMPVQACCLPALGGMAALGNWLLRRFPAGNGLPDPMLIVGAGRLTHLTMLAAQRSRGGRTIVLMNPGLPRSCFDLCLIPRHDAIAPAPNVMETRGALNTVRPSPRREPSTGLMLIGGESKHYAWHGSGIMDQVREIALRSPQMRWTLTTSRRTPAETLTRLQVLGLDNVEIVMHEATTPDWLPTQMATASQIWVTPDSVSMLYESLTSGAAVGLFDMEKSGGGRVTRGVDALIGEHLLTSYATWVQGEPLHPPQHEFNEAARCARWIKEQWFPGD